ncbi:PREDICTED: uncharacterized protein LOC109172030 [Ipomoea nil]|uniref:uncharacterized protein LOC109172030 n=1 Tax=Ipomoea nil TaxID=35883 RepID=UPI0009018BF7|nr:PREDICTED: uncharacterized protein LOC109172030 [Ipomoea nil]XP_019176711.1 PREDICTED: uncharacterized protein LOC109172030 [Ipomoea nil]
MVLGLRSRHKKGASVQVDFVIHVEEVKPWPPSQSLRSVRSVLLVWQNGDQNSGSFISNVGDASIEFNESFALSVTLCHEKRARDKFQKNLLNLYLYEPRKDKASRGQLLGTATLNLADFGAIEEDMSICTPVNSKKSSKSFEQPSMFVTVQPVHKDSSSSSSKVSLSKRTSTEKDEQSIADSVNGGNDDQSEIASFTDDDVSSHSSLDVTSSSTEAAKAPPPQHEKDGVESAKNNFGREHIDSDTLQALVPAASLESVPSRCLESPAEGTSGKSNIVRGLEHKITTHIEEVDSSKHPTKIDTQPVEDNCFDKKISSVENSDGCIQTSLDLDPGRTHDLQESQGRKMSHAENKFVSDLHVGLVGGKDINNKLETEQDEERIPREDLHVGLQELEKRKMDHPESDVINNLNIGFLSGEDIKEKLETEQDDERIRRDDLHVNLKESQERNTGHAESEVANDLHVGLVGGKDKTEQGEGIIPVDHSHVGLQESQERKMDHAEYEVSSIHDIWGEKDPKEKLEIEQEEDRIPRDNLDVGGQESQERQMKMGESKVIDNLHADLVCGKDINKKLETEHELRIPRDDLHVGLWEPQEITISHAESEVNNLQVGLAGGKDIKEKLETEQDEEAIRLDDLNVSRQEPQEVKMDHAESEVINSLHVGLEGGKDIKEKPEIDQVKKSLPGDDLHVSVQESQDREMKTGHAEGEVNNLHACLMGGKEDVKEKLETERDAEILVDAQNLSAINSASGHNTEKAAKINVTEDASSSANAERNKSTNRLPDQENEWKSRIEILEEELREAAAVEVSLYSIVAEHVSSSNKVHAPARRLSRLYFHACKVKSQTKQASCARTAVSGLALVSKACGNDVPRLTFWLSNTIMLRAIVSQAAADTVDKNRPNIGSPGDKTGDKGRYSEQNCEFDYTNEGRKSVTNEQTDWGDRDVFTLALEQVEAWIFSRIVESVWWQIFIPHMQRTVAKTSGGSVSSNCKKGTRHGFGDEEPGSFSIDLWEKAFRDACERLCPVRAEGHECGCLSMLAKMVMEQLVSRLDVAMFNAILRVSADEMPTDPVSDPISNPKVLPIPVGKLSFGAGAQLKNAVGNWSRWLSDLFETEDNEFPDSSNTMLVEDKQHESHKPFRLLNALSDLMMLPFEMLADPLTRKEVSPLFSPSLIKIILSLYVPDEFSPHPVPEEVFVALDSEDDMDASSDSFTMVPCTATPTVYSPPTAASVTRFMGESGTQSLARSASSVLKKSYTSDDELDEVDSPLTSIIADRSRGCPTSTNMKWTPGVKGGRNLIRYQLLRELWRDGQ